MPGALPAAMLLWHEGCCVGLSSEALSTLHLQCCQHSCAHGNACNGSSSNTEQPEAAAPLHHAHIHHGGPLASAIILTRCRYRAMLCLGTVSQKPLPSTFMQPYTRGTLQVCSAPILSNWTFLASPCLHCAQTSLVPEVLVSLQTCLLQHSAAVPPMSDNVVGLLQLAAWCTPTRAGPPRCAAWRTQSEPHMPCCLPVQLSLRPASRLLINEDDQRLRCCSDSQARRCL